MSKIDDILRQAQTELGSDLIATDVVGMDGLSIGGVSNVSGKIDFIALTARFAMVMSLSRKVGSKIKFGTIDHVIVTTGNSYIVARFLGDGSYFWVMSVTNDAVLGMVNMVFNDYQDQLWNAIPH